MSCWDKVKNFMGFENGEYEEEEEREREREVEETPSYEETNPSRREPRLFVSEKKTKSAPSGSLQEMVIRKPERFDEVTEIADLINSQKGVFLNLETIDRDTCRRIIDFLSGVAYANHGKITKASKGTLIIVPKGVDVLGEDSFDEYSY
ncbi:MAG: cell division protein SepF [Clostridiales bacterium]|nr:cell division protein SepF [Candidatus Equinaster intestinalis]